MGMDLGGKGGYFSCNNATWVAVLRLAYDHGWKPAGTEPPRWIDANTGELCAQLPPDMETWNSMGYSMDYYSNSGQGVSDQDARNIADALERALEEDETSDEGLAQSSIDCLREFITFCRAGGFLIA